MSVANVPLLGAVAATAAAIPAGLYFGSTTDVKQETPPAIAPKTELVTLKDADEYQQTTDNNKFGWKYSYYFLTNKEDVNTDTWNQKLAKFKTGSTSLQSGSFFDGIKTDTTVKQLKDKCKEQYDKAVPTGDAEKWKEVWKFCSLGDDRPTTITEAKNTVGSLSTGEATKEKEYTKDNANTNKWGESLKDKAISVADSSNDWFWTQRDAAFKAGVLGEGTTFFTKSGTLTIKTLCLNAYEKTKSESEAPSETDIKKCCALSEN